MRPPVVFLVYRDGLGPIFGSVYLRPASRMTELGFPVSMAISSVAGEWLRPEGRRRWRDLGRRIRAGVPGGFVRFPAPPSRVRWWFFESGMFRRWILGKFRPDDRVIVHCGGTFATEIALRARQSHPGLRIVHHCWGPEAEEYRFAHADPAEHSPRAVEREASFRDGLQGRAFRGADASIVISDAMTRFAVEEYGADPRRLLKVPCFVDTKAFGEAGAGRESTRAAMGLQGRLVVAYCGSILRWQLPEGVFRVLRLLLESRSEAHFLAVTTHPAHMQRLLREEGIPEDRSTVVSVPHEEVPRLLAAADIGILGRGLMEEPRLVNAVSSPVKYGEYLASGLPVIMGEGIGDFSGMTREERVGLVLRRGADDGELLSALGGLVREITVSRQEFARRCRRVALDRLDFGFHMERIAELYVTLTAGKAEAGTSGGSRREARP